MLNVVSTPIGNIRDITLRALDVLEEADAWVVEDSRRAGKLREHLDLPKKEMIRYYDENEDRQVPDIMERLNRGDNLALMSDAGTPLISDPGYKLVKRARDEGIDVRPIPGPTAGITALSVSGFPSDQFLFYGYVPRSQKARRDQLLSIQYLEATVIFFEAPHRIEETLTAIRSHLGDRSLFMGREMTKQYEQYREGTADQLLDELDEETTRGEFTILVHPYEGESVSAKEYLRKLLERGLSLSDAAGVTAQYSDHTRNELYEVGLDVQDEMEDQS